MTQLEGTALPPPQPTPTFSASLSERTHAPLCLLRQPVWQSAMRARTHASAWTRCAFKDLLQRLLFLRHFGLWLHSHVWVVFFSSFIFVLAPYTFHPPAMLPRRCVSVSTFALPRAPTDRCKGLRCDCQHCLAARYGAFHSHLSMFLGKFMRSPSIYMFAPIIVFPHTFMQKVFCTVVEKEKEAPPSCTFKETPFTTHASCKTPSVRARLEQEPSLSRVPSTAFGLSVMADGVILAWTLA